MEVLKGDASTRLVIVGVRGSALQLPKKDVCQSSATSTEFRVLLPVFHYPLHSYSKPIGDTGAVNIPIRSNPNEREE